MDDSSLGIWLLVVIIISFNGVLAASEIGVISLRWSKLLELEEKDERARIIREMLNKPEDFFACLQIWVTLLSVGGGAVATLLSIQVLKPIMGEGKEEISALLGSLMMTLLLVLFGELVPKNLALRKAESLSLRFARILRFLYLLTYPVVRALGIVSGRITTFLGGKGSSLSSITEEEIKVLLERGSKEGSIEEEEKEMISSIFEFTDTTAKEIMVPRIDVVAVEANQSVKEVLDTISKTGFSRLPVYKESLDNVIGIVHAKDAIRRYKEGKGNIPVRRIMRPAYFVPESKKIDELLREMQMNKTQMAIVVDEYGGTAGIVTLEDILEEIVGEIEDEYDREREGIQKIDDTTYIVDARMKIEDVNEELSLSLPEEEEVDTIGGLVYALLGKVPEEGESVEYDSLILTVVKKKGRRITRVKIEKREEDQGTASG